MQGSGFRISDCARPPRLARMAGVVAGRDFGFGMGDMRSEIPFAAWWSPLTMTSCLTEVYPFVRFLPTWL